MAIRTLEGLMSMATRNADAGGNGTGQIRRLISSQLDVMSAQLAHLAGAPPAGPSTGSAGSGPFASSQPSAVRLPLPRPPAQAARGPERKVLAGSERKYLDRFILRYNATHKASKAYADRFRNTLADSRRSAGFRPSLKAILYPIVGRTASGAHMQDIDGNDHIDLTMGFGVLLDGHNPAFVQEALNARLAAGLDIGPQSSQAGPVAEAIAELTGMDRVAFCNSGTEAVMTALRLARATTGRTRIAMFSGSYHGHFDGTLAVQGPDGGLPLSPGTPQKYTEEILVVPYGSDEALATLRAEAGNLAAVLVEPVQSRALANQPQAFLHALRDICSRAGSMLLFDEMLTGFRIAPGGAQAWFGIRADIATYGKIVGGGMPIGVVAGHAACLDGIDGGDWGYEDDSYPAAERIFFAGTYNKNAVSMAVSQAVLRHLRDAGPQLQSELNSRTLGFVTETNLLFS
jgi:glutamate-1-semialdehyde aminotransferase